MKSIEYVEGLLNAYREIKILLENKKFGVILNDKSIEKYINKALSLEICRKNMISNTSYLQGRIDAFTYIKESLWIYQDDEYDEFEEWALMSNLKRLIKINENILNQEEEK